MEMTKKNKTIIGSLIAIVLLIASSVSALAYAHEKENDDKSVITYTETPENVKHFLGKHFAGEKVDKVVKETEDDGVEYEVLFLNGTKVEIDEGGNWEEISNYKTFVPKNLIPSGISEYLAQNYPTANVVKISQSHKGYKVKLDNSTKLKFNAQQELVKADNKKDHKDKKDHKKANKKSHNKTDMKSANKSDKKADLKDEMNG